MIFGCDERIYWENKVIAYLHDSPDKIFWIPGHEERAGKLLDALGLQKPNSESYKIADAVASGFERGYLPSHSKNANKNGAISLLECPFLTHPISKMQPLRLSFPEGVPHSNDETASKDAAEKVSAGLIEFMKKALENEPGLKHGEESYAKRLFFFIHLVLRFKLSSENICGLGAFWHRIPADTRIPDHSIWQHNALTAALSSSADLSKGLEDVALMTYTITPVQSYINCARRLRDYWTGSVILSWLAFEGLACVMENLGPDHILYPSLIDQPLVRRYLEKKYQFFGAGSSPYPYSAAETIASFPNKFVCLIPFEHAEKIASELKKHIDSQWKALSQNTSSYLSKIMNEKLDKESIEFLTKQFEKQTEGFWNHDWAAVRLLKETDHKSVVELLPEARYKAYYETISIFSDVASFQNDPKSGMGLLYGPTHSLSQVALSAAKGIKRNNRPNEQGEKCIQCGEFEVLHLNSQHEHMKARDYTEEIRSFWRTLRYSWPNELDFRGEGNERLCANCFIKRVAYKVVEADENHILYSTFAGQDRFPSTTELSLYSFFKRNNITLSDVKRKKAQNIYEGEEGDTDIRDHYYAILYMDGDKMGKLVGGATIGAEWESVLQKPLVDRLKSPNFETKYHSCWKKLFDKKSKRLLTPAIHSAISESLGDFALYGVAPIIDKYEGKLIYAGGDDVCAVLPIDNAIVAAREIRAYYHQAFQLVGEKGTGKAIEEWGGEQGKISIGLGISDGISISGAILLCHHKEGLKSMLTRAHDLLNETAKKQGGRDCLAVELFKRSGGSRIFYRKWDDEDAGWKAFGMVHDALNAIENPQKLSRSLIYNLSEYAPALTAIINTKERPEIRLEQFIAAQIERSAVKTADRTELAKSIVKLIWNKSNKQNPIGTEGLVIAAFLAGKEEKK